MFKISDMMEKEVVDINNGKKLGFINDIELDLSNGQIRSLIIMDDSAKMYILGRGDAKSILWENICKIGHDTILVDLKGTIGYDSVDM